jgi:predicted Zn-dependent protease
MDEPANPDHKQPVLVDDTLCAHCRINKYEEGHRMKLCTDCRQKFINYPIPKWITLFALGIVAVIIVSLIRTQMYIGVAIHLGKGEKAIEQSRFVTAERELNQVLNKFPDDVTANADMVIAACYNLDPAAVGSSFAKIEDKKSDDEGLLSRLNTAMEFLAANNPKDTVMYKKIAAAKNDSTQLLQYAQQLDTVTTDPVLKVCIGDELYDMRDYQASAKVTQSALKDNPDMMGGLRLMSAIDRETGKYDEALDYCDKMLNINKEDIYAMGQKAKIELKRNNDAQAAKYAQAAMHLDPDNDLALEASAMVDYYTGHRDQSNAALDKIKAHLSPTDSVIYNRLNPILNGSQKFR